jgi:alpha-1,6-mannosyltransferase
MGLRGANPYVISASKVSTMLDPFLYWLQTSTYGPISEVTFVISALFIKFSPILAIYVFKAFCLLAHILNAYLIWRILLFSPHRHILTAAYLFSPFLLIAHIADAHVDVFLCTSIIVLLGCLHRQFYLGAVLALIAGFLTKTLPVIWFPLVFLFLIRQRRWKTVAVAVVMSGAIFLLLSQTLFPNLAAWKSLLNPGVSGMTARSLHHLVNLFWGLVTHSRLIQQVGLVQQLSRISLAIFALFYAWKLARLYFKRNYSEVDLVPDLGWVTLFLLLGATPWLMSWYPSILLPIGILSINAPIFTLVSFVFPLTAGAVIGAGSGDTLLSLVGCFVTLVPTFAILLFRRQLLPICQAFTNTESVPSDQVVAQTRQLLRR